MEAWKEELDAIVGARHGGQIEAVLARLKDLDTRYPQQPEIVYQLAWTCDVLGREADALPFYERALALGLPPNLQAGALLGLGSTLRCLGQHARSIEVLTSGKALFPDAREFDVFLALGLHHGGRANEAFRLLLETLLDTTEDVGISAYQRALRYYARELGT